MRLGPFNITFQTRQAAPQITRCFDGAAGGRRGGGMGTFGPIQPEIAAAGPQLRSRARFLAMNNPWLSQAVANWAGALMGSGIVPTGAKESVAAFTDWGKTADADGLTDFRGLQSTVARAMVIDGESFVQISDADTGPSRRRSWCSRGSGSKRDWQSTWACGSPLLACRWCAVICCGGCSSEGDVPKPRLVANRGGGNGHVRAPVQCFAVAWPAA